MRTIIMCPVRPLQKRCLCTTLTVLFAFCLGGCKGTANATFTRTKTFEVTAAKVSVEGGANGTPVKISASGLKAKTLNPTGPKIVRAKVTVFVDRDGDNRPLPPTEIEREREIEDAQGTAELELGDFDVQVGPGEPVKAEITVELDDGTTYRETKKLI